MSRAGRTAATLTDAGIDDVLSGVPCLSGRPRQVQRLSGGLTNVIVKVTLPETGRELVARIGTDDSAMLAIDRDAEHQASIAAAAAGVAPEVACRDSENDVLVIDFVPGRTLAASDLRDDAMLPRVAQLCRDLHAGPRFSTDFDMFAIQRRYLHIVQDHGYRLPAGYSSWLPSFERIRSALSARPAGTRPCHNDLLAENFIDDGDRLWMVDFEYCGNNDPAFELGNIASESGLDAGQLGELVRLYHGAPDAAVVASQIARARLLGTASRYGWTLWASIQDSASSLDFDFWSWGLDKYERSVQEFRSPDFDRLIAEVTA